MKIIQPLATMVIRTPVISLVALAVLAPVAVIIRHRFRILRLYLRGWRRNTMGEMVLNDDADVITVPQLIISSWDKILDEHPVLQTPKTPKGGILN